MWELICLALFVGIATLLAFIIIFGIGYTIYIGIEYFIHRKKLMRKLRDVDLEHFD